MGAAAARQASTEMPTKRRPIGRKPTTRITPELVRLYTRVRQIAEEEGENLHDLWEDQGGRRGEYLDAYWGLHFALGLAPWECNPTDVHDTDPNEPAPPGGQLWRESWPKAQELCAELEELRLDMAKDDPSLLSQSERPAKRRRRKA